MYSIEKRKQSAYKPGSVHGTNAMCLSFIQYMRRRMSQAFYPLPNSRAGSPDGGSLHELAAPKVHSRHVTMSLVSSYLTFSPLPHLNGELTIEN